MKRYLRLILVAVALVAASAAVYTLHYAFFHDAHHIWIYLVGDIAFVPIEVLLVAVVIERLLAHRDRRALLEKMNMVIGTFFSELGTDLLGELTGALADREAVVDVLSVNGDWTAARYRRTLKGVETLEIRIDPDRLDLARLSERLASQRGMLVRLLANPNLLEHEAFTDLLWAVFHLADELAARPTLADLPEADRTHLAGDVRRVYRRLAAQWLRYCEHLQKAYPYIFSIVVRTHPLQPNPSPTVT